MQYRYLTLSILGGLMLSGCNDAADPQASQTAGPPQAVVENGVLEGMESDNIHIFKGIPYAQPPTGDNRWRAPQPVAKWDGVKEAKSFGNDCMQKPFPSDLAPLGEEPAEDCLYMNVWAPAQSDNKHPVVIWIHGGGYVNGGASPKTYDGSEFAKHGVVFASFNYRLGRFGFFAHPALTAADEGPLGNYGFLDQRAALAWVHKNIEAFGGDPEKVTIMGESAGGGSVFQLLQTPSTEGEYQRAIIMSGGGRSLMGERPFSDDGSEEPSAEEIGVNFAKQFGITGADPDALAALRDLSAEEVTDGLSLMAMFESSGGPQTYVGGPVADGDIVSTSTEQLIKSGDIVKVPLMIGTTSQDIGFSRYPNKDALFASFGEYESDARQAYDPDDTKPFDVLLAEVSQDRGMQEPARFVAQKYTEMGEDVYLYRFDYVGESERNGRGAPHASDIPFFFNTVDARYKDLTEQDAKASDLIFSYVVSFIENGNPNIPRFTQWQPYNPETHEIMTFTMDAKAVFGRDPWTDRLDAVEGATENQSE